MKVVCGLGNPGPEYAATRHNVGWRVLDELRRARSFPAWRREGRARVSEGGIDAIPVRLVRPVTYMNRSGAALAHLRDDESFDIERDLLVIVDDAALEVGRIRFRASGSAGGHNGLKSIEAVLGTRDYARLRVGVGILPDGEDLSDWVLTPFEPDDEEAIVALLPTLAEAAASWVVDGVEAAANRFNR
ncbi:MAG: aminoacyl-tRNA hydrolase [Gemmatimonadetes bacterium]|nr:aminoacyl-tRNA hydrolase [Gemmatimonadota bacterium]